MSRNLSSERSRRDHPERPVLHRPDQTRHTELERRQQHKSALCQEALNRALHPTGRHLVGISNTVEILPPASRSPAPRRTPPTRATDRDAGTRSRRSRAHVASRSDRKLHHSNGRGLRGRELTKRRPDSRITLNLCIETWLGVVDGLDVRLRHRLPAVAA